MLARSSNNSSISTGARRYPLSYIMSGFFSWGNGNLNRQESLGLWWSTVATSATTASYLDMNSGSTTPQNSGGQASGISLRWALSTLD